MTLKTIETNLIDTVKASALGPKLRVTEALPGRLTDDVLRRFMTNAPGVYFTFIGGRNPRQATDAMLDSMWAAYVVTDRNDDPRVLGPSEIIDVLVPLLHGHTITDIGTLQFERVENLFNISKDKLGAKVYAVTFSIPGIGFPYEADMTTLNDFITYHAEHSMAEGTDEPAAIDEITLPQ